VPWFCGGRSTNLQAAQNLSAGPKEAAAWRRIRDVQLARRTFCLLLDGIRARQRERRAFFDVRGEMVEAVRLHRAVRAGKARVMIHDRVVPAPNSSDSLTAPSAPGGWQSARERPYAFAVEGCAILLTRSDLTLASYRPSTSCRILVPCPKGASFNREVKYGASWSS
jgi:hypothetical protein